MHVLFYLGAFCLKQKGEKKRKRNKSHENNEMIKKERIEQKEGLIIEDTKRIVEKCFIWGVSGTVRV